MLTGKYVSKTYDRGTRFHNMKMYQLRYLDDDSIEITNRFLEFAKQRGYSPVALAIAWAASHPGVTSPLLGARNTEQLTECLKAGEIEMTADLRREISALSPEPPLATDRSDELIDTSRSFSQKK